MARFAHVTNRLVRRVLTDTDPDSIPYASMYDAIVLTDRAWRHDRLREILPPRIYSNRETALTLAYDAFRARKYHIAQRALRSYWGT